MTDTTLDLGQLLDLLGHELVALCWKPHDDTIFRTRICPPAEAAELAAQLQTSDVWYSINEPSGPAGDRPRGDATNVTHLRALWADLDIKPGGFDDDTLAWATIDDLSSILGAHPVAITHSGHGLQPIWQIDPDDTTLDDPEKRADANALLARWRRLVETVAAHRGAAVDAVYDLPRILRAPGTINWKNTPVPTSCEPGRGAPVTLEQIRDALDAYGVVELASDPLLAEPVDTSTWTHADHTCPYARDMIRGWGSDTPDARHPWLLSQATRLAVAHRYGCLTTSDHTKAATALGDRMRQLCAAGSNARSLADSEVRAALDWGTSRAALLADTQVARELGGHDHTPRLTVIDGGNNNLARLARLSAPSHPTAATATALEPDTNPDELDDAPEHDVPATTLTDDGNTRLFVHHHAHHLRYSAARGWLDWDGCRWHVCEDDAPAVQAARDVATSLGEHSKEQVAHKRRSLGRAGIENMVALARRDPVIRVTADELDSHRMHLNTPDGTINLRTGRLHPHRPEDLHTKIAGTGYNPDQPTPRWLQYLDDTFGGDQEMIGFLQRLLGVAASGHVDHHILPFLHGGGKNGKSVLTNLLLALFGDYATVLPSSVLIASRYGHDTALSKLPGARIVVASELPSGKASFDEERVKMLTGGDLITTRELYKNPFTFTPSHTLILAGNHQPAVDSGGVSFWRRLRLIPFGHTVPVESRIEGLDRILVDEEGPGILAWITTGTRLAHAGGLAEPASVLAATQAYEDEEDAFGQFVDDCLHVAGGDHIKFDTTKIRQAYSSWCRDNGRTELSAQAFGRELRSRTGARTTRSHGRRYYTGIALIDTGHEEDDGRPGS